MVLIVKVCNVKVTATQCTMQQKNIQVICHINICKCLSVFFLNQIVFDLRKILQSNLFPLSYPFACTQLLYAFCLQTSRIKGIKTRKYLTKKVRKRLFPTSLVLESFFKIFEIVDKVYLLQQKIKFSSDIPSSSPRTLKTFY